MGNSTFDTLRFKDGLKHVAHSSTTGQDTEIDLTDSSGVLGAPGNTGQMTAGTGITTGTGTVYSASVIRVGNIVTTRIYVDITGLDSNVVGDVIGVAAGAANCHLGQITTAVNGLIMSGRMMCGETPLTGEPDIDLWSADEATLAEDTAITAATGEVALVTAGADWTIAVSPPNMVGRPIPNQYLYLVGGGGTTDDTYTAGKFIIELLGYIA